MSLWVCVHVCIFFGMCVCICLIMHWHSMALSPERDCSTKVFFSWCFTHLAMKLSLLNATYLYSLIVSYFSLTFITHLFKFPSMLFWIFHNLRFKVHRVQTGFPLKITVSLHNNIISLSPIERSRGTTNQRPKRLEMSLGMSSSLKSKYRLYCPLGHFHIYGLCNDIKN